MKSKYTKEALDVLVLNNVSIRGVLRELGVKFTGGSHAHIKSLIHRYGINTSHFSGQAWARGRRSGQRLSPENVLVIDRNRGGREEVTRLRKALLEIGLEHKCCECGIKKVWNNKPIQLEIDHINGEFVDNRRENLRFLCPNCHSQMKNFAVKNRKPKGKIERHCSICIGSVHRRSKSGICPTCAQAKRGNVEQSLVGREVSKLVWTSPMTTLAKQLGCSANGLKKYCQKYKIEIPVLGYWTRRNAGQTHEQALNPVRKERVPEDRLSTGPLYEKD